LKRYLIDTNICIYFIKGKFDLKKKFEKVELENCFISEITLAELMFGVENSSSKDKNQKVLDDFMTGIKIIPIFHSLKLYAKEKARLQNTGNRIDDFDLLIGVTAITHNLTMVTNNSDHFKRIKGIILENWAK
jgi:tRNA(fMet)-specific endonuclease VapC